MRKTILIILAMIMVVGLTSCGGNSNGKLFVTDYDVEDYCEEAIIVSKSDGKVYGVLDNKGKEIFSLEYDDIEFINKDEYIDEKCDNLYICTEYEGEYTVYDLEKKEIIKSEKSIYSIDYKLEDKNEDAPIFKSANKLYDKNGNEKMSLPEGIYISQLTRFISGKCCLIPKEDKVFLCGFNIKDYNGNNIGSIDNATLLYECVYENMYYIGCELANGTDDESPIYKMYVINSDGAFVEERELPSSYELQSEITEIKNRNKDENKAFKLYKSNSTWKLEDFEGNTLYEERYYEKLIPNGENDCVALTNEDDELCIIGHQGTKYIDFGVLKYDDDEEEVFMLIGKDTEIQIDEIFEGKNSIIIPVQSEEGKIIYCFSGK